MLQAFGPGCSLNLSHYLDDHASVVNWQPCFRPLTCSHWQCVFVAYEITTLVTVLSTKIQLKKHVALVPSQERAGSACLHRWHRCTEGCTDRDCFWEARRMFAPKPKRNQSWWSIMGAPRWLYPENLATKNPWNFIIWYWKGSSFFATIHFQQLWKKNFWGVRMWWNASEFSAKFRFRVWECAQFL